MTYEKPDLEFVGAASTIVLGGSPGDPNDNGGPNTAPALALGLDE
jgi:hypothetical protein